MAGWTLARLRRSAPAEAASVSVLRHAVSAFAVEHGATSTQKAAIELAVSEACTNAVQHAYRGRDLPGDVILEAHAEPGRLAVAIIDDGDGMRPRADSPGLGLGLPLIATVAESVHISGDDGTRVLMSFPLGVA